VVAQRRSEDSLRGVDVVERDLFVPREYVADGLPVGEVLAVVQRDAGKYSNVLVAR